MGLLARVERRGSLENPSSSLANPETWLVEALGGGQTAAGKNVNHASALKLSAVWACVKVISEDTAKLPLPVYRRLERGKERAREHPLYRVLNVEFNSEMSSYNGRRTLEAHVLTWGAAFAEIERNGSGDIVGLWPLLPDRTRAERIGGQKIIVTRVGGKDVPLAAENVLHIPGLGFDGLRSYSVIAHARQAIGAAMAAEEFGAQFFGNGAVPGGVIMRESSMTEEAAARLRRSWGSVHQGLSGAQRVAILEEGMKYEKIGIPPEDAQFISTRQYGVEDIVRYFRVPPHKVQHLLHAGVRANVEAENISYVTDTLQSWLVCWEQEINRTLFREGEKAELFAEHLVEGLLRGDSAARGEFYQKGINNGWLTPNEAREMENRNPIEGGDRLFVPLNLVPLDSPLLDELPTDEPDPDPEDPEDPDPDLDEGARTRDTIDVRELRARRSVTGRYRLQQRHMSVFTDAAKRVIAKEVEAVAAILDRTVEQQGRSERSAPDFLADLGRFYDGFEETVRSEFVPVLTAYGALVRGAVAGELGAADDPDPQYDRFVSDYAGGMARRHVRKSRQQVRAIVREADPEELRAVVEENLGRWTDERPAKVALAETVRSGGAFAKAAYQLFGVLQIRWVAVGENCPYCAKLNGRTVGVRDNFVSKGDEIVPDEGEPMAIKAHVGHPPAHASCNCQLSAAF